MVRVRGRLGDDTGELCLLDGECVLNKLLTLLLCVLRWWFFLLCFVDVVAEVPKLCCRCIVLGELARELDALSLLLIPFSLNDDDDEIRFGSFLMDRIRFSILCCFFATVNALVRTENVAILILSCRRENRNENGVVDF